MKNIFIGIAIGFLYTSCNSSSSHQISFSADTCIKEINRSYASVEASPKSIYKLEEIVTKKEPQLKISIWHNHSWYYQGLKRANYFANTNLFKYESTKCPDGSGGRASMNDKLKSIDI